MRTIPKKIHYCWFGPKPFDRTVQKCLESWQIHLKDYEFFFWNEKNSPMEIPFIREAYLKRKYAFVSDCVRFYALHTLGGIYLDTDMYLLKSLDPLISEQAFFGWETGEKHSISCGIIGSPPGNQFIGNILEYYKSIRFETSKIDKFVVPRVVNRCYDAFEQKSLIKIYPFDYFYPFPYIKKEDVRNFMEYATRDTYAIHLWNISWGNRMAKLRDMFLYHLNLNR